MLFGRRFADSRFGVRMDRMVSERTTLKYPSSITRQGLILCLGPLLISTASLLALNCLWTESVQLAHRENDHAAIAAASDVLLNDLVSYQSFVLAELGDGTVPKNGTVAESRLTLQKDMANLRACTQHYPAYAKLADATADILHEATDEARLAKAAPTGNEDMMDRAIKQGQVGILMTKKSFLLCGKASLILTTAGDQLASIERLQAGSRRVFATVVYGGALSSFAFVIALMVRFNGRFRKRFQALVESTEQLGTPSANIICLHGNDEAAALSRALAEAQIQLQDADLRRKAIVEMVAHDVRSPLMATHASLRVFLKKASTCGQASFPLIEQADERLKMTFDYADKFLDQERSQLAQIPGKRPESPLQMRGLGIFQKVLLLALIPLLVQTGWLFWIAAEIDTAYRLQVEAQRQVKSMADIDIAIVSGLGAFFGTVLYAFTKRPELQTIIAADLASADAAMSRLSKDTQSGAGGAALLASMRRMRGVTDTISHDMIFDTADLGMASHIDYLRRVQNLIRDCVKALTQQHELQSQERKALEAQQVRLTRQQSVVQHVLLTACIANVVTAALLVMAFSFVIQRRLSILMQSVESITSRNRMRGIIGGTDELSLLYAALANADLQLQLMAQHRQSVINSLTDQISHPLSDVERDLESITLPEAYRDLEPCLEDAKTDLNAVLQLFCDLVDFESVESGNLSVIKSEVDVAVVIAEAVSLIKPLARQKNILIEDGSTSLIVQADKRRVRQVMLNLLSNAVKFSPEHSRIAVSTGFDNGHPAVFVEDEGAGVAAEHAQAIFEERTRLNKNAAGFGLGLAICRAIVQAHGGVIGVTPRDRGPGSRFYFTLPAVPEAARIA